MTQALKEYPERRRKEPTAGNGWVGFKYVRYFTVAKGDVETHRAAELAPGAVLPAKWGGVATTTAADPRLQVCVDLQQGLGAMAELYTEWIEITPVT